MSNRGRTGKAVSVVFYAGGAAAAACVSARRITSMRNVWRSAVSEVVAIWYPLPFFIWNAVETSQRYVHSSRAPKRNILVSACLNVM